MSSYALSLAAEADLRNIYFYSLEQFGFAQAENYMEGLAKALSLLAENPKMGRSFQKIRAGLRRHVHARHSIYYRIEANGILILRILGVDQDPARHL
ncbi:type II toxin-antitoxin system RelE/ParE family toxin [Hoeflea poritis]|uniref:Toxin n=1 Tax=Hoeflea poritis TaxID=2993659 RepID=A0ABT4VTJ6_9HYPH|nr:type II toxin-antitoxin system RelE/ParE family toxin [Hoeflea poritis]MDA4847372.1 type II toxin-antitoxin system RelE/ParE family toxin [Hoeflea poritis]